MSEVEQTSSEDKFFGVKKRIGDVNAAESSDKPEIEVEIVDDAPAQQETQTTEQTPKYSEDPTDEELSSYTQGVQKRINQLTARNKDDKRKLVEATKVKDEAIRIAQLQRAKIQEYEKLLPQAQASIIQSNKGKAQAELSSAERELKKAHEEGDADKLVESQKMLAAAQAKIMEMENREAALKQTIKSQQQKQEAELPPQQPAQEQPQKIHPKIEEYIRENPWFIDAARRAEGNFTDLEAEMTGLAATMDTILSQRGITPETDPDTYFATINEKMRQRFPDYKGFASSQDEQEDRSTPQRQRSNTAVVAPSSSRNNGAKTRKIQLTPTMLATAKQVGVTPEQYAAELMQLEGKI